MNQANLQSVGLWQLVAYFLRLGAFGFGGPIALAGYMQRDLVPRKWITEEEYVQGLAFSQMMPGPLAAQLAKGLKAALDKTQINKTSGCRVFSII